MKIRTTARNLILTLFVLAAIATDATANRRMEEQLDTMNEQLALMQKRFTEEFDAAEKRMKDLEAMTQQLVRNQAELLLRFESMVQRLSVTDGKLEQNGNALNGMLQELTTLTNRVNLIAREVAGEEALQEQVASDPEILYDQAYEDYLRESYAMAIGGFQDYLSSGSALPRAADAQYWIGEAQYAQGRFREAIVEFRKVVTNHPGAEKAGDALLKIGLAQYSLGNYKDAAAIFEDVIAQHPNTPLSRLAEDRLKLANRKLD